MKRHFLTIAITVACLNIQFLKAQEGDKLFKLLSPKESGISFNNKIKDTKEHSIMIYSNYYGGAGVGIGDLNNDGLQDIFLAGNLVGDELYLNKGGLNFEKITGQAGISDNGGWSSGVLMGDVNQDGWLDIYVTRELYDDEPELRRNKLYINNGDLTFTESAAAYGVDDPQRTRHAAFLDYDKDGDLDLLLLNQPPNPGDYSSFKKNQLIKPEYHIRLMANEGGQYREVTEEAGLKRTGFPNSVSCSDLNGDGWTDLFIANDFWIGDWLFMNNGDGTFTEKSHENLRHISFSSMGVDAGDIDNDGLLDLMVLDMVAEDNYRLKTNMSGMNPKAFWKVVKDGGHFQYMFNMLHLNRGGAQFSDIAQLAKVASTDWSWSNFIADLDNDGWKDIYVTNGLMRDIRNNDATKVFRKHIENSLHEYLKNNPNPGDITIWDVVDLESSMQLVPSERLSNYVFRNNGDRTFSKKMEDWGMEQKTFSNGASYADLDNDGDLDVVVNNVNDVAFVYENQSDQKASSNYVRVQLVPTKEMPVILGSKVWIYTEEGTQFFEITRERGMYSSSEPIAHFGLGTQKMVDKVVIQWPDGTKKVLEHIAANQVLNLRYEASQEVSLNIPEANIPFFSNISDQALLAYTHQEDKFDDFTYQVLMPHKMSTFGPCMAKADLNGDGLEDVFIGGAATFPGRVFLQEENGHFSSREIADIMGDKLHEDVGAVFFDIDNDGDQDLYVASGGNEFMKESSSYQDRLYLNDGQGNFSKATDRLPKLTSSASRLAVGDIDNDGDLDLFVGGRLIPWSYPEPASSTLLINEGGKLIDATAELAPELVELGMVNDGVWVDYDQDGWEDLVVVGEWMPISLFHNEKGKLKRAWSPGLRFSEGWWFSVEAADVDKDGDLDLVAGNLGENYKYQAEVDQPFEVYYYDFDKNDKKDVVLTYYNFGIKYPVRGRQCSSEQVPALKNKFKTYDLFASSDVFEIYGENKLENSLHYAANTFSSMYIENLGNGQFEMRALPQEAQFSAINDIQIHDVNLDGHLDLVTAGNLFNAEVETARNDAGIGLVMLGDGAGNFTSLTAQESGLLAPFNVKSLELIQSRQGKLLLVGCNDDPLQLFKLRDGKAK